MRATSIAALKSVATPALILAVLLNSATLLLAPQKAEAAIVRTAFDQVLGDGANPFTATGCLAGDIILLGDSFFDGTRSVPTVGGVNATFINEATTPNDVGVYWGLVASNGPAIVWNYSVTPAEGPVISWACYSGTDTASPIRTSAIDTTGDTAVSLTLSSLTAGDMAHLFLAGWNDNSLTATGDLTSLQVSALHNGGNVGAHGYASVVGTSVTLGYSTGNDMAIVGIALKPDPAPSAPQNLLTSSSVGNISLTWVPPANSGGSNLETYGIWRSASPFSDTADATLIASIATTSTTYADTSVVHGTNYHYRVTATNGTATSSPSELRSSSSNSGRIIRLAGQTTYN